MKKNGDLSDGHGAENVEENERAVGEIFPRQITMGNVLQPADWHERQSGNNSPVESTLKIFTYIEVIHPVNSVAK